MPDENIYGPDLPQSGDRWKVRNVNGRKDYVCCECAAMIGAGSEHQCASGKWGEEWFTFRTCLRCLSLRTSLHEVFGSAPFWGNLAEFIAVAPAEGVAEARALAGMGSETWK